MKKAIISIAGFSLMFVSPIVIPAIIETLLKVFGL